MKTHGSLLSYTLGFILSIALTLGAFWIAPTLGMAAVPYIIFAALLQLFVQLTFFLHLRKDAHSFIFFFTLVIVVILVGGTLWIMNNLEHLHMQPMTTDDLYEHGMVAPQNELK